MAKTRQSYTVNNIGYQSATSGRVGQTASGRFTGARRGQTMVSESGARSGSYGGRMISRKQQYRDIRAGLGLTTG